MGRNFCYFIFAFVFNLHYYVPSSFASPIMLGVEDKNFKIKYHVSVHIKYHDTHNYAYACGGTLIKENYVLSVAHCFVEGRGGLISKFKLSETPTIVIAGTNKIFENGIQMDVARIYIPNAYESQPSLKADLAIIMLSQPINFRNYPYQLKKLDVAQVDVTQFGLYCGFGYHSSTTKEERALNVIEQFSDINRSSGVIISDVGTSNRDHAIIAALPRHLNERTPCHGDEGAGLVQNDQIVGILFGRFRTCIKENETFYFTRLGPLMSYIESATNPEHPHNNLHIIM